MRHIYMLIFAAVINSCSNRPNTLTGLEGNPMPSFNLLLMDSSSILNTHSIPSGKPIVMFFFTPHCPYCRAQTKEIVAQISSLNDIKFYILSSFPFVQIKNYYAELQLNKFPEIIVGQDYENFFQKYFNAPGVPYLAIYNRNKQLKQIISGKIEFEVIKKSALQ